METARAWLLELAETLSWLKGLGHAKRPARRLTVSEVRHLPAFQPDPEAVRFGLRRGEVGSDRARDDLGRATMAAQTMVDKIWGRHVVAVEEGEALLYVDRAVAPGFIDEELRASRQDA